MQSRCMEEADAPGVSCKSTEAGVRPLSARLARFLMVPGLVAIAVVGAACSSSPSASSSASSFIAQGLSAESSGQTQQAINDFHSAVSKDPTNAISYYDLGVLYQQRLNQPGQASDEYNKALLANPNYKPALFNLAILDTSTSPQSAISLYNQLLKIDANDANVNFNLGLLLYDEGQTAQGILHLQKAIVLDPSLRTRVPKNVSVP